MREEVGIYVAGATHIYALQPSGWLPAFCSHAYFISRAALILHLDHDCIFQQ